ncbi:MAG: DUF1631 family protein, partial [Rubrivivax sp.]
MNPPHAPGLPAAFDAALKRVKGAARTAAERCVDSLGTAALASANVFQRDSLLGAQFELNRKLAVFCNTFDETLDRRIEREILPRDSGHSLLAETSWDTLSLVDNSEVEMQMSAERLGLQIGQGCENEQLELDTFVGSLLSSSHLSGHDSDPADKPRNPLRPEIIGVAVMRGVSEVTDRAELRKVLASELERTLAAAMAKTYAAIVADFRAAGVKPAALSFRSSHRGQAGNGRSTSGYDTSSRAVGLDSAHGGDPGNTTGNGQSGMYLDADSQSRSSFGQSAWRASQEGRLSDARGAPPPGANGGFRRSTSGAPSHGGTPFGQVDAGLMSLIRRLAFNDFGAAAGDSQFVAEHDSALSGPGVFDAGQPRSMPVAPNLIHTHRNALRQAASGSLDHMVIDVIAGLFDQILSDPKVAPQMARQIARLQLPVLRAALGDASFFSSRKHPVRRFINRIASLGSGFDDFESESGQRFAALVRDLVQEIVSGDFDQIEVYEQKLAVLEAFIVEQTGQELKANGDAASLLAQKETDLRLQQRYAQQLRALLEPLPMADFVRDFLSQVWSQALRVAARLDGADGARVTRLRHAGRELIMSVQPKGSVPQRKTFLAQLPTLMKELNEGMDLIGWSDASKKTFFGQLLPAHAESLKGEALRTLDYNLLVREVDTALGEAMPKAEELPPPRAHVPVLRDEVIMPTFSAEEAQRIGLVDEAAIDWDGKVDIELGTEPEVSVADQTIEGLPAPDTAEPAHGKSLADHVQIGFAYQMHLESKWHKVRLSHVSPGRTFFVFTRGSRHKQTISMTHRMLVRMCDTERLRAFESGYLLERATARARKQLAAL